jgi:DNA-binding protein H-NS
MRDYHSMPIDELWELHEQLSELLAEKAEAEIRIVNTRLARLSRTMQANPPRRYYPEVKPRYQNPHNPGETWSGRGRTARWVSKLLASGLCLDDLKIKEDLSARSR